MNVKLPTNRNVLRRPAVLARTGLRPTALEDAMARGEFPRPISLTNSGRAVAWLECEIDEWLLERLRRRAEVAAR